MYTHKRTAHTCGVVLDCLALGSPLLGRRLNSESVGASVLGGDASEGASVAGDERHGGDNVEDDDGSGRAR